MALEKVAIFSEKTATADLRLPPGCSSLPMFRKELQRKKEISAERERGEEKLFFFCTFAVEREELVGSRFALGTSCRFPEVR